MYPAYFCLWWPTRIDFTEFLIHAQGFLASARAVLKHPCCPAQRKVFDGFNIFVDDSPEPVVVPLEECADFDLEILKQYIGPTSVQMVRISTEIGDICYDFEAYGGIPQRAGIISHHAIAEPIAELLRATNHLPVSIREARRVLEGCFGARNEWKEGRRHEV